MDSTKGDILKVVQIDQSPEAQWALLRRCPFKYEHLEAIIKVLEQEQLDQKQQQRQSLLAQEPHEVGEEENSNSPLVFVPCEEEEHKE